MSPGKLDHVWVIAYINRDYVERVESDLLKHGFGSIHVYIPTVRILKKQFKNKNIYDYIPLLFNYGFFQLPYDKACDGRSGGWFACFPGATQTRACGINTGMCSTGIETSTCSGSCTWGAYVGCTAVGPVSENTAGRCSDGGDISIGSRQDCVTIVSIQQFDFINFSCSISI